MAEVKPGELFRSVSTSEQTKLVDRQRWSLSLLYLENRQHLRWDRNIQRYLVESGANDRQVTINHILPIYRNVVARFQANYPGTVALPASPSTEDIVKATMTNLAVRNHWLTVRLPQVIAKVVRFLATCGTSALHTFYDPITEDVSTVSVDPYNLFAEGGSEEWEESDKITIRAYVTPQELKKYVGLGNGVPESLTDEVIDGMAMVDPSDARMFGKPFSSYHASRKRIELYETYWRDGTRALWTQSQVVWQGENKLKGIPVRIMRYTPVPKRLWGISLIYPLIELQWLYNQGRGQIQHNIEHMSNPKWLIPKNAGIPRSAITNKVGEKVFYNGAAREPKQIAMAPIPGYVVENISRLQSEMQDVAGTHSVSLGKRSVGVHSGEAIRALSARDSSQLQLTQEEILTAVEMAGNDAAQLMKMHYPERKWMRMLDSMGQTVYHELKRTDLQDDPEVYIEASTLFRDEAQDRDQRTLDELQAGLLEPSEAKRRLSTHIDTEFIKYAADMSKAHDALRELTKPYVMDDGSVAYATVEIFRTDNLKAYKEVFEEYVNDSDEFDKLPDERQDYIRDVLVAILSAGDPQKMAAMQADPKVWPPKPADIADVEAVTDGFVAPQSVGGQQQAAEAAMQAGRERQEAALARSVLDEEPQQGLSTAGPGGQRLGAMGGDFV